MYAFTSRRACAAGRSGNGKFALLRCESHVAVLARGLLMPGQGPHGSEPRQDRALASCLVEGALELCISVCCQLKPCACKRHRPTLCFVEKTMPET